MPYDFASLLPDLGHLSDEDLQAIADGNTAPDNTSNDSQNVGTATNPYLAAQMNQESGGKRYDKNGSLLEGPMTKYGTAKGEMQVLDSTNLDPGYGVVPAKDNSPDERARVGRDYSIALQKHYGDPAAGLAAYNWGPGNYDDWVKNGADPKKLPKETKDYVKNILAGSGKQYAAADTGIQTDAQYDDNEPSYFTKLDGIQNGSYQPKPNEFDVTPEQYKAWQAARNNNQNVSSSDLSHLSDDQLMAIANGNMDSSPDLSHLSDEELMAVANKGNLPGLGGAENMQPIVAPPAGPQVPFMGIDGKPVTQQPNPTAGLMLAGPASAPDFWDRMHADSQARNQQAAEIEMSAANGAPEFSTQFRNLSNLAGRGVDLGMNAIGSGARAISFNPDKGFANPTGWFGLDDSNKTLSLYDIAHGVGGAAKEGVTPYLNPGIPEAASQAGDYLKSHPGVAMDVRAMNDLAMVAPFAKPAMTGIGMLDDAVVKAAPKIAERLTPMGYGEFADKTVSAGNEGAGMKAAKAAIPTGDEMAADASSVYKSLPQDAEALSAPSVDKFTSEITAKAPQTRAGKIVAGDNALTKIVDRIAGKVDPETGERVGGLKGQPMTMAEAQEVDEALGDHIDDLTDGTTGRLTKQGKKVLDIQTAFRKAIQEGGTEGGDQLALARAKWAQASRMREVERINARAELMDNPITGRKTGYRNLYLRLKKNPMGYSPQEIALIKKAADSGVTTNVLKLMGSRLGPIGASIAGTAAGGPLAGMAAYGTEYAIASGARNAANKIHLGRDTAVKRAIAGRPMPEVRPQATAEEVVPEVPAAPKQITFQPDIVAGSGAGAVARPATGEEMAHAEAARRLWVELGIDQDPVARKPPSGGAAAGVATEEAAAGNNQQQPMASTGNVLPEKAASTDPFTQLSPENKRLADEVRHPVHGHTYREALAIVNDRKDTFDPNNITLERQALQNQVADELYGNGARTKGKRIDIVMGPPGAGKSSSIVKNLLEKHGGIEIDADSVKEKLPEYDHGLGANQTHGESKWITQQMPNSLLDRAAANGDNIVHPVVGKDLNRMQELVDNWHDNGYNVNVHYADVPVETSVNRVIKRYGSKGRALPLSYVINEVGEKPRHVFEQVIKGSKVNDYSHYNTDVPTGQKQILIKSRTDGIREGAIGDRHVLGSGSGSVGETQSGARSQPEVKAPISEGKPIKVHAHGEPDTAITPTGKEFNVRHAVVSGDDLIVSNLDNMRKNPNYPQILQPRDRTSMASRQQITKYANDLNPRLLMNNPLSSEGAPIISKDGVVESGNGRTLSIKRAMSNNTEGAAKYKKALKDAGYDIRGVKNPVLVRIRETPMTDAERVKMAQDNNADTKLGMSSVEQATQDAGNLSTAALDKYRGGDIKMTRNREFAKDALKDILPENEQASIFGKHGELTQGAENRLNAAMVHKAYGDENITRLLTESIDNELTSYGRALTSVAPVWAKMREAIKGGHIPANMDVTPLITDATEVILRARRDSNPVSDYLRTDDLLKGGVPQDVRDFLDFLHQNNKMTKFISHDKIVEGLSNYANEALKTQPGVNLFGEKPLEPSEILKSSYKKALGESNEQSNLFGAKDGSTGEDVR